MRTSTIVPLVKLDVKSLLRDRRTVILSLVLPLLVMPIFMFASTTLEKMRQEKLQAETFTYAVAGDDAATGEVLRRAIAGQTAGGDGSGETARSTSFEVARTADPEADLRDGKLDLFVETLRGDRARELLAREDDDEKRQAKSEAPVIALHYRSDSPASRTAMDGMRRALEHERTVVRDEQLAGAGFPIAMARVDTMATTDLATPASVAGSRIAMFLTALMVFLMFMGGAAVATDVIAGEKERGTLETLLSTAAERNEIVAAKLLVVLAVTITIVVLELGSLLAYGSLRVVALPAGYESLLTARRVLSMLVLYVPLAALMSSVLLLVSGYARSYKEAQTYFFPVTLVGAALALVPALPGLSLRSAIAIVPISGIAVAVKEVLVGKYDWPMLAVAWLSTAGASAFLLRAAASRLSSEDILAGGEGAEIAGGPALFPKRVLRWFAMMWVAVFVASSYASALDLRLQVVINLVGIFLVGSLLMLRVYRLDPRTALSLKMPRPLAWVGVLVGAPSALVVAIGVSRLVSLFLPVPRAVLEEFGKALFPENVPLWQMLIFIAILPGICEEIAFRGMLLHGLRRRFKPVTLCLVVGLIFGLFHFTLFRIAGTAFLGVLLAAVTLLTGSIFPAMLWHALNNGLALLAAELGFSEDALPWWSALVALVPLAGSYWLLRARKDVEGESK